MFDKKQGFGFFGRSVLVLAVLSVLTATTGAQTVERGHLIGMGKHPSSARLSG
jgi:hypothetical protein